MFHFSASAGSSSDRRAPRGSSPRQAPAPRQRGGCAEGSGTMVVLLLVVGMLLSLATQTSQGRCSCPGSSVITAKYSFEACSC